MAVITDFTTADAIRALLGVSSLEIEDAVILLPNYLLQFQLEVEDIDKGVGGLATHYATVKAITPASNRTAAEQRFFDLYNMFAAYSVARQLLAAVDMFAPQQISDSKAVFARKDEQTLRLEQALMAGCTLVRNRLLAAYLVYAPAADVATTEQRSYVAAVGLGSDPVLGT